MGVGATQSPTSLLFAARWGVGPITVEDGRDLLGEGNISDVTLNAYMKLLERKHVVDEDVIGSSSIMVLSSYVHARELLRPGDD